MKGKRFSRALPVLAVIFVFAAFCAAQDVSATLAIESISPPVLRVEGRLLNEKTSKNWTFVRAFAGVENLGERISELSLKDENGRAIFYQKLIPGEFLASDFATGFSYKIDLSVPKKPSALAHVSWLADEQGLLMLYDLLPQFGDRTSALIRLGVPQNWMFAANESFSETTKSLEIADVADSVIFVGKRADGKALSIENSNFRFVISGEFLFSRSDAESSAGEIAKEYEKIFGAIPRKSRIFLLRFPREAKIGNWEAETRGSNVVILSSDMPFKNQSIQRLHEQLRHELFHLWIPNDLALTGNYDWFYEGFALYQSLRVALNLNRIRFEDFLDTLGRAYDLDGLQERKVSLIEASKNRWSGANAQIYARGMLVAFLCDIAVLRASKGKRSVSEIVRAVYQKYRKPNKPEDGNAAIASILEAQAELRPIVERYIKGAEKMDWLATLEAIGVETSGENFPAKLVVKSKLNGRQKDLLDKLGYNNWRKLVPKSK